MAAVSPNFVKTAKGETGLFIKAICRPNRQVRDCVTRAVGFAENVRMAMAFERFSLCANASEDA